MRDNEKNKIDPKILNDIKELARIADEEAAKNIAHEFPFDKELSDGDKNILDALKDTQNPDISYKLFYAIQALMKQFLPKGAEFKRLRDYTYELKNILLTQGKRKDDKGIRHGDSRQAYISTELQVMYDLMKDWVSNGATAAYLIDSLQSLNDERGYDYEGSGKRRED